MDKLKQKEKEQAIRQLEKFGFIVRPGYPRTEVPFTGLVGKRRTPLHVNSEQGNYKKNN
ncbi:hypothetical protein [Paenibacillus gallinarum]|uniref:Uncharacterized protein n=1 Tax=Paenibacillus gallinarum TaxID=2762232 RepID=A0ABR8T3M5_9BACL|nr:hypothetical protein [Paenibacillus gallinarum]MBD7970356.1 hypothetical protein [Paenibacillus gallinarum]